MVKLKNNIYRGFFYLPLFSFQSHCRVLVIGDHTDMEGG